MKPLQIKRMEFHITNSCNLNCHGCDTISNYNVSSHHESWAVQGPVYARWAEILDIDQIGVQGGEPMTNPDYQNWLIGLRQLWPRAEIWLATNGLLLHKKSHQALYQLCLDHDIGISVSLHNEARVTQELAALRDWLQEPIHDSCYVHNHEAPAQLQALQQAYVRIKDPDWPDCANYQDWLALPAHIRDECGSQHDFVFWSESEQGQRLAQDKNTIPMLTDANQVRMLVKKEWNFVNPIVQVQDNTFVFHNSDPDLAHSVCNQNTCYQFYQGAIHKCAPSHVFKDIVSEFATNLSSADRDLINSYKPAQVDMPVTDLHSFIEHLPDSIAQCKFCPSNTVRHKISAESGKKIHVLRPVVAD